MSDIKLDKPGNRRVARLTLARPEKHNAFDDRLIADVRAGAEGREGVSAFLEKHSPAWRREGDD